MLAVPGLSAAPLRIAPSVVAGPVVSAAGYPDDDSRVPVTKPVTIREVRSVEFDIAPDTSATRIALIEGTLRTELLGGPLLTKDGTVVGMVYRSELLEPRGYAHAPEELTSTALHARTAVRPVPTGECPSQTDG